jgi:hypothetical protein
MSAAALLAGCEQDKEAESARAAANSVAATPAAPAPSPATPPVVPPGKQTDLGCPSGWEEFCGGWTVYESTAEVGGDAAEHIGLCARLVIGEKGGNVYAFPRGTELEELWGGVKKVKLDEIATDGPCLIGKIKLKHDGMDKWHRVTFTTTTEASPDPEIGDEVKLHIAFVAEAEATPPPASCPTTIAQGQDDLSPDHGGLAHAED